MEGDELTKSDQQKLDQPLQLEQSQQSIDQTADEIPKEKLIQILKEKQKESKSLQNKLNTLEQKYVKSYKEKKVLIKDMDVFKLIISKIFDKEPYKLQLKPIGEQDIKYFEDLYEQRENFKNQEIKEITISLKKQKEELEKQFQKKYDSSINSMDQQNQQIVANLKKMKQELESNSSKLAKEIIELNDIIQQFKTNFYFIREKNQEIEYLKKIEEEYQSYKADFLLKELQKNKIQANNDISSRIKESEKRDSVIKLKNELESAYEQIQNLELKMKAQNNTRNQKSAQNIQIVQIQSSTQEKNTQRTISIQTDEFMFIKPLMRSHSSENHETGIMYSQQELQQSMIQLEDQDINFDSQPAENILQMNKKQDHTLNQEYLKNVVLKYFVYQEGHNYRQANLLMNTIMTILRMSPIERQKIESARSQTSIWNTAKTWLTWSKYQEVQFPKSGSGGGI